MVDARKQEEKTEPTVYSAAIWWRNCDPFLQVVGIDAAEVEKTALDAMNDAVEEAYEDSEPEDERTADDYADDICWSGVCAFALDALHLSESERAEVLAGDIVYPDLP